MRRETMPTRSMLVVRRRRRSSGSVSVACETRAACERMGDEKARNALRSLLPARLGVSICKLRRDAVTHFVHWKTA